MPPRSKRGERYFCVGCLEYWPFREYRRGGRARGRHNRCELCRLKDRKRALEREEAQVMRRQAIELSRRQQRQDRFAAIERGKRAAAGE